MSNIIKRKLTPTMRANKPVTIKGHTYCINKQRELWHWQHSDDKGSIGWLFVDQVRRGRSAYQVAAQHAVTSPVDHEANEWATLIPSEWRS